MRTRNERRQRRQELFWSSMVCGFVAVVLFVGVAAGMALAGCGV